MTVDVALAYCHDCDEGFGPDLVVDVGEELAFEHFEHDVSVMEWTEE